MPRRHVFRTWDDYFIPRTSVLRNKFTAPGKPYGEPDPAKLRMMEEAVTAVRIRELHERPIEGRFDYEHMKAIHGYIFQDVYEWAGQERVGPTTFMVKDGHSYYPAGSSLTAAAEAEYAKLADKNLLRGLDSRAFVSELAESWECHGGFQQLCIVGGFECGDPAGVATVEVGRCGVVAFGGHVLRYVCFVTDVSGHSSICKMRVTSKWRWADGRKCEPCRGLCTCLACEATRGT